MFEAVALKSKLAKENYDQQVDDLRMRLLEVQQRLDTAGEWWFSVWRGWISRARAVVIGTPNQWLDPRYMRFWRHLPRGGKVTLYDRGGYGRILVARVEGFAEPAKWGRAYSEIKISRNN
ncbi:hypothetical protein [Methylomagnum ishizawai]|uniref:hypothetical protein n=1 Tax=Methylomagnum ishizawai TaxID=1760988 RepID=UPI001C391C27|nr:hypothetical protein [Methylomagnum ishizawai]